MPPTVWRRESLDLRRELNCPGLFALRSANPCQLVSRGDESIVLGFLRLLPCTGFDLRGVLRSTPLGHFSDSPGSIYPLLTRLERAGLIRGTVERRRALRPRKVYRLTPTGTAALREWLVAPIAPGLALRHPEIFGVRFAFMEDGLLSAAERGVALRDFERNLRAEIDRLTDRLAALGPATPPGVKSLLAQAVDLYELRLRWVVKERRRVARGVEGKS